MATPATDGHFEGADRFGPTTVLVDTSLLIELQKRRKYSEPVRISLEEFTFRGASSYSKLEFKRAWLQRLAFIHATSSRPDIRTIADLLDYLNRKLASQDKQRRRLQTCLDALIQFFDLGSCNISSTAQLVRLRAHCKRCVLVATVVLADIVTAYFKHTKCSRAEEPSREMPDGSLDVTIHKCKASPEPCEISQFFQVNTSLFAALADYIDSQPESSLELQAMRDHIRQALKTPTHLCNDKHCAKVADAIIAIDGIDMHTYAANNPREWTHICSVLHKPLLNPVLPSFPEL